jgi:hypothetical protein
MIERSGPSPVESAKKACTGLHNTYRSVRLYPSDHPSVRTAFDTLVTTLDSHLESAGPLTLQVEEDALLFEDERVYTGEVGRDNLAFLMFRDGIRSLTFQPGVDTRELEALVDCLAHADQLSDSDQDFATALWGHDLVHIEYEVVDPFLEGDGVADDAFDDLRETVFRRMNELTSVSAPGLEQPGAGGGGASAPSAGAGGRTEAEKDAEAEGDTGSEEDGGGDRFTDRPESADPGDVALTEADLERSEWLVANQTSPLDDFAVVIMEIIGDPSPAPFGEEAVIRSVEMLVQHYLDDGDLDGLDLVMGRLSRLEQHGRRPAGFGRDLFCRAATAERLTHLIAAMSAADPAKAARIERFLRAVHQSVYPALLETLATSDDKGVRKIVLSLLNMEGGVPVKHLWPLMNDPRWYVVRNAVQLATGSGDPELIRHLERLLRHTDERVRREVIRSLDSLADVRVLPLLVRALQDEDGSVRILAVRSLGRRGARGQFPAVAAQVESRDFETRSPEEVEAFLTTFAVLGGDKAVEVLNRFWKKRVFGTRPMPLRLAAIQALGAVSSPEAKRALGEAARSGEPQLQRAAARAVIEARGATRGWQS